MIGGLVGAGLKATGLVEPKGSDKPVGSMGPFGGGMMGVGGLAGMALQPGMGIGGLTGLATQGGFLGNTGGLFDGALGQMLPPIDPAAHRNQMRQKKIYDKGRGTDNPNEADTFLRRTGPQLPLADSFMGPSPMASMYGGPQMGQAGGLLGNANFFSDPMTIKYVS